MNKIDLENFVKTMIKNKEDCYELENWWFAPDELPAHDFNREIFNPGMVQEYPDGALGVRVDADFWMVAILPYKFSKLSIEDIVSVLWPDISDPMFGPDSIVDEN